MDRIGKLRACLPAGYGAALVTSAVGRFYLLGFDSGDAGMLLIFEEESYFIIDSRYIEVAGRDVHGAQVVLQEGSGLAQVAALLRRHGVRQLLVEDNMTLAGFAALRGALEGVELDGGAALRSALEGCRRIKDADEWQAICTAQQITDDAFAYILGRIAPGRTEVELAGELEYHMRKNGAGGLAFPTILITGAKTSMPHGVPGAQQVCRGDFVTMDFGASYGGYCADMTRTVAVGEASEEQRHVYDVVLRAQLACCAFARAGQRGCEVDKVARDIIYGAGYEGCFGHGLGHSVGIEIHENPRYSAACQDVVAAGTVMTIEPGIYLPGRFGVRIEDTVLVCEEGVQIPGHSPKELLIV